MYNSKTVSVGTHDGIFHYDELVSVALISILYGGKITLVRTRNPNVLKLCDIVVDVGGGPFDHHMPGGNGKRESGTPYASAGLVWKALGEDILKALDCPKEHISKCRSRVDSELLEDLDKIDNGIKAHSPFEYISYFLPCNAEPAYVDVAFTSALNTTVTILRKALYQIIHEERDYAALKIAIAYSGVENIMEIPSQFAKWQGIVTEHNNDSQCKIDFVIFPYPAGGYAAQCVPPSLDEPFKQRISFPKSWAGQTEKLPEISGVKDATFCHNACFFVRAKSRQSVIELCRLATKANNKN